uniref:hypothetical protein n=1 Tax=Klebsiella aerogenes TaxID=548 RepID=UPI0013D2EB58|nr:hypothetical protein [Klebsiella aerogenes]
MGSVSPYARRLFNQAGVPDVDAIDGPASCRGPATGQGHTYSQEQRGQRDNTRVSD